MRERRTPQAWSRRSARRCRNLTAGDRVLVPFNVFCGSCWYCARGMYANCHNVNPNATAVGGIYG
jgi:S-(hydroxymethyl)glutathione dehydrogenase/alcohol dehydrogenase